MAVNVNDIIRKLSPARRKKVEARAAELSGIAEDEPPLKPPDRKGAHARDHLRHPQMRIFQAEIFGPGAVRLPGS